MEPNIEQSIDVYSLVTNRIIELLEAGTIPWHQSWTKKGIPRNCITKRPYQGVNSLLLNSLPYDHNLFLTWKQVKVIGGSVLKGEKGHIVVFNKMIEKEDEGGKMKKTFFLRFYKVFNVAQCKDLPSAFLPRENETFEKLAHFEEIVDSMPKRPEIKVGGDQAYYQPIGDYINMPPIKKFGNAESYYGVLFHELIHSTGHETRLKRKGVTEKIVFGSEQYSFEELIAEIGACFLKSYSGLPIEDLSQNAAYIQNWLEVLRDDKRFIIKASSQAQRAVEYIMNIKVETETENKEENLVDQETFELEEELV
jgi:antirestriction protein ArdC